MVATVAAGRRGQRCVPTSVGSFSKQMIHMKRRQIRAMLEEAELEDPLMKAKLLQLVEEGSHVPTETISGWISASVEMERHVDHCRSKLLKVQVKEQLLYLNGEHF